MRLWHKELLTVLPKQQLLGQWRECCCIAKAIHENGTPNHILVNKIMDYPIDHFFRYCVAIKEVMTYRGYQCDWDKCRKYFPNDSYKFHRLGEIFPEWHNNRYLRQCYHNLEEKYDCGGITEEEWNKVREECMPRLFW